MTELTNTSGSSIDGPSAKEKAADVADTGRQAASDVANTATDAAEDVAEQTKKQASDLVGNTKQQLTEQAGTQQTALVATLRDLGDQLESMTEGAGTDNADGTAVDLAAKARDRARSAADWLDGRSPAEVVDELRTVGRRRPGAFLLGSLVAGVVAGRLTRGVVDVHTDDSTDHTADATRPQPTAAPVLPAGASSTGRHEAPRRVSPTGSGSL